MAVTAHDQVDLRNGSREGAIGHHPQVREHKEQVGLLPKDRGVSSRHLHRIEQFQIPT